MGRNKCDVPREDGKCVPEAVYSSTECGCEEEWEVRLCSIGRRGVGEAKGLLFSDEEGLLGDDEETGEGINGVETGRERGKFLLL